MRNMDVNRRFSDWLLNPRETLDFEVKGWLDLSDEEHRAFLLRRASGARLAQLRKSQPRYSEAAKSGMSWDSAPLTHVDGEG
jgi:hypothetical protein